METRLIKLNNHVRADIVIVHRKSEDREKENAEFLLDVGKEIGARTSSVALTFTDLGEAKRKFDGYCQRVGVVITSDRDWAQELKDRHSRLRVIFNQERAVLPLMREFSNMPPRVG